ncbi:YdhR family protein [Nocardioides caldifontis]|uniref:YdhR family protein n=1 Tax=Nocardioides caldifontis TaxID=2588938 RepID=UPI001396C34F|nr:YdhR family protein [Nocardioides caldifontis]
MHLRIVTFRTDLPAPAYEEHAMQVAPLFREWPGLDAKLWLADAGRGRFGGVYLFGSRADADASRETALFREMASNPHLAELEISEYDVLAGPTAVTAPHASPARPGGPHPLARIAGVT